MAIDTGMIEIAYLDCYAVILVPNCAVVDPNISPGHIEPICVKSCEVNDPVMVLISSSGGDLAVSDLKTVNTVHPEGPVG